VNEKDSNSRDRGKLEALFANEAELRWDSYPMIEPGIYPARSTKVVIYPVARFGILKARIHWEVFDKYGNHLACLCQFYNLGDGKKIGRGSNYFKDWIAANGAPPKRGDRLSTTVFENRTGAVVEVSIANVEPAYSVVRKVRSWGEKKDHAA